MIVKTRDLTGAQLDWAVAKAEGKKANLHTKRVYVESHDEADSDDWIGWTFYSPSTDWSRIGPIIEREKISLAYVPMLDEWAGISSVVPATKLHPSPLVAAARCFVESKLGEEVDIPEGLV
jgi:hypothetical protein